MNTQTFLVQSRRGYSLQFNRPRLSPLSLLSVSSTFSDSDNLSFWIFFTYNSHQSSKLPLQKTNLGRRLNACPSDWSNDGALHSSEGGPLTWPAATGHLPLTPGLSTLGNNRGKAVQRKETSTTYIYENLYNEGRGPFKDRHKIEAEKWVKYDESSSNYFRLSSYVFSCPAATTSECPWNYLHLLFWCAALANAHETTEQSFSFRH